VKRAWFVFVAICFISSPSYVCAEYAGSLTQAERIEKLQDIISKKYEIMKKDPKMTEERINKVCDIYNPLFVLEDTLPRRLGSLYELRMSMDFRAMTNSQKDEYVKRRSEIISNVSSLLHEYQVQPYVFHDLVRQPNYCAWRYELNKINSL